jgi:biopolymer transport protein ExbD
MAEIAESGGGGHDKGKKRAKKQSTKVDMTPMVDLAFLLLTFFVLTATFSKPKVMSLVYPAKPKDTEQKQDVEVNNAVTFLLAEDRIFYYEGAFYPEGNAKGKPATTLEEANFGAGEGSVRELLSKMNRFVLEKKVTLDADLTSKKIADTTYTRKIREVKSANEALKVLIKTDNDATCKNFIDLIDELKIADIGVIAPVDIMQSELDLIKAKTGK